MDAAVVLGALVPSWSTAVVLVSYLAIVGAVVPGVQPDRTSHPSDLFPLREARRPSRCNLHAERHGHWYERMQPKPTAEGDASASSSSSPLAASRRHEPPTPAPTNAVSALFPAPQQPLVGPSSVLHRCSSSAATSLNLNISMTHPLNNKTCKGWETAVLNNLRNSVGGP